MEKLLNKKFNIRATYENESKGIMSNVYFLANNMVEIEAFVMDDVEEYQDYIKEEMKVLKNAKTKEDIVNYLTNYAGWEIIETFEEKDFEYGYNKYEDSYLLDFIEFKIAVRK